MPTNDVILTVLYAGAPLIEVLNDGKYRTVSAGVNQARLNGSLLDVDSTALQVKLVVGEHNAKLAGLNPYGNALRQSGKDVLHLIPLAKRRGMQARDVATVMETIVTIANKEIQ
jgi:hypothetical protein